MPQPEFTAWVSFTTLTWVRIHCDHQICSLPVWHGTFTSGLSVTESPPATARYDYGVD
ncbi:MAG: hypothetical protein WC947_10325 [Elusimicrobiota bacterium]